MAFCQIMIVLYVYYQYSALFIKLHISKLLIGDQVHGNLLLDSKPKVFIFSCHRLDGFGCNLLKVDLYKLTSDLRH